MMAKEAKTGNQEQLWESHFFGKEKESLQIERLSNLEALPFSYA